MADHRVLAAGPHGVVLGTGPEVASTHWHQMVFHLSEPVDVRKGQALATTIALNTKGSYHREMNVRLQYQLGGPGKSKKSKKKTQAFTVVIIPDTTNWNG